jgi:hypothetical protein
MAKDSNRLAREAAVKKLNEVAEGVGIDIILVRAGAAEVSNLYKELCGKISEDKVDVLLAARGQYVDHGGGGDLPPELAERVRLTTDSQADTDGLVSAHRHVTQSFYNASRKAFRLQSKAFMLTFNSIVFVASLECWKSFVAWFQERAEKFTATAWSCTMERSLSSTEIGRVHFHCYFSWHKPGSQGIDHRTTDEWTYCSVRPRVDTNSERRGPHEWLRATQHGHFYVSVDKRGTLYTDTNYPPWESDWVPEAWWVVSLWREHKLEHDKYMSLSIALRDGHDRRKANAEIVQAAELAQLYLAEKKLAMKMLSERAKPFKPLPPSVEAWKMHYEELDDRYKMLVLHGPSRTGKSRLAKSLFGSSDTFVVDIQHAAHPDLRGFRRHQHKAILLDEMQSAEFIVGNKKVLQAHVDGAILGQSATQLYTYEAFLWRVPIVITTNNWNYESFDAADRDWIQANCIEVLVDTPVWKEQGTPPRAGEQGVCAERDGVQGVCAERDGVEGVCAEARAATPTRKRATTTRSPGGSPEHKVLLQACPTCGQRC